MLKAKVSIEKVIDDKHFQFLCPSEASYQECLDILELIKTEVSQRLEKIVSEMKDQEQPEVSDAQIDELQQSQE